MSIPKYTPTIRLTKDGSVHEMTEEENGGYVDRFHYGELLIAAQRLASNFETYGSAIKVTVPMALLEELQKVLAKHGASTQILPSEDKA